MRPLVVKGTKVSLGVILREDLEKFWLWYNDPDVRRFLANPDVFSYRENEYEWYDSLRKDFHRRRVFAIVENSSQEAIGVIGLHKIDWRNGTAEVGYWLWKEYWGRGYGSEAVKLLVKYAFEVMNLRKLYARVLEPNEASKRILEKNGFKLAGRLRKHHRVPGGDYVDMLIYELFRYAP